MGHHHSGSERQPEPKQVVSPVEENAHPFLTKNDLTYLSVVTPFLSDNGKKLISFFINFNNGNKPIPVPDLNGLLNQVASSTGNKLIQELLPAIMSLAGKSDLKGGFDPSLITSLIGMLNNNKKED